jgi:aspartyl-tRNA(Asn)/glutamyl-tRNA(Gln) amidotransferase subunit C
MTRLKPKLAQTWTYGIPIMDLTPEQIRQVAHLARLELSPEQIEMYRRQLTRILAMVDQLSSVDTAAIEPMAHPLEMAQRLRPDSISAPVGTAGREALQSVAPAVQDGVYLVPRVLE